MTLLCPAPRAGVLLLALISGATLAQPVPDRAARAWAASCAACHGTDGRSTTSMPTLAGRNADELVKAFQELRAGQRPNATVMHQHAKGYTDDELRRIAQVFAAQAVK